MNRLTRAYGIISGLVLAALLCTSLPAWSADSAGRTAIDWQKAKQLYEKRHDGQTLTADEQAYLQRAMQAHAAGEGPGSSSGGGSGGNAAGNNSGGMPQGIDWERAKRLYARWQQGETLNAEDQAYLDKAKAAHAKAAGGRGGTGGAATNAPPPRDHTGLIPLDQMTAGEKYKGEDGGLYGQGRNTPPAAQQKAADRELAKIVPLGPDGQPATDGKIVLISIGMSNTTGEFQAFLQIARDDPAKSARLVIVDCAQGGQDAERWSQADMPAWHELERRLQAAGVTPQQVQVAWVKHARMQPSRFGDYPAHGEELGKHMVASLQIARQKMPNLRIAYLSSRIYAGYAGTALNPEPYAYEGGLVVRRLIRQQIAGDAQLNADPAQGAVKVPLLLWGPYLWGDGVTPRKSDGLVWNRSDLGPDGTHPSRPDGAHKVAQLLLGFFKTNPNARSWFTGKPSGGGD